MEIVAAFGLALIVAALVSGVASRTPLSTSLLVLLAGVALGPGILGWLDVRPEAAWVSLLTEVTLVIVLFTDGHRLPISELRDTARLGGRALVLAMPLTMIGIASLAVLLTDLDWSQALLVGAVLAPTDPVFAAALVQRDEIAGRLRRLLNLESGINDGLALPIVLVLLALEGTPQGSSDPVVLTGELVGGVVLGITVPALVAALTRIRGLSSRADPALLALGTGIAIFGIAELVHANPFLAAFAGGVTSASLLPRSPRSSLRLGEDLSEGAKLLAVLVFGALLTPELLAQAGWGGWVLAVLALFLVRPAAVLVSMLSSRLTRRERLAAAWFGPKGFASVVYGLLVLESDAPEAQQEFAVIAVCVALSILVHSSTDVPVARWMTPDDDKDDASERIGG